MLSRYGWFLGHSWTEKPRDAEMWARGSDLMIVLEDAKLELTRVTLVATRINGLLI